MFTLYDSIELLLLEILLLRCYDKMSNGIVISYGVIWARLVLKKKVMRILFWNLMNIYEMQIIFWCIDLWIFKLDDTLFWKLIDSYYESHIRRKVSLYNYVLK